MNRFTISKNRSRVSLLGSLLLIACSNSLSGLGTGATTSSSTATTIITDGSSGSLLTITSVVEDPNIGGTFDIVGDGSNAIGNDCPTSTSTSTGTTTSTDLQGSGASACQCYYQYTRSDGSTNAIYVDTTYHEANLVRCPYDTIPTDVVTVNVSLYNSGQTSNIIAFNLDGAGAAVNLTSTNSFAQVQRYQCKDNVSIPFMMAPPGTTNVTLATPNMIYDPIQSEDPNISYPLDFYTSNFGGTFSLFASNPNGTTPAPAAAWHCPSMPNDPNFPGLDLSVFSVSPDSNNSQQIYPPTGSAFDRSTFYVAKQSSGVFNVALDTYVAPTLYGNGGGASPVGYGAAPIATSTTTETCPDTSVPIPSGYKWAKLWMFRAGLNARTYRGSSNISGINIGCNPGTDTTGAKVFPQCSDNGYGGVSYETELTSNQLSDRVVQGAGYPQCFALNAPPFGGSFNCASGNTQSPGCTTEPTGTSQGGSPFNNYGLGSDVWGKINATLVSGDTDALDLYSGNASAVPSDVNPTAPSLDAGNTRYDFLLVVTPISVMAADMESGGSDTLQYTPYRFQSLQDCPSSNPQDPSCNPNTIIHYSLVLHDVSTNGNPGANDTNANGVFPMCVLQPI